MWEAIGITVEREPIDFSNFLPNIQERTTSGHSWIYITPFYADPAVGVQVAYAPTSTRAHFNDPAINDALTRLSTEPDRPARYAIIKEMSRELVATMSAIPLFTQVAPYAAGDAIGNWVPTPGVAKLSSIETITP
jgi:ABC-type transport system substrate-binding protein